MTTDPVRSGLHPFSQLKAGPTTSSSTSTALPASVTAPAPLQPSHRPQLSKSISRDEQLSATSDKATVALIRRVLCPPTASHGGGTSPYAPEELLPPLTSSNDVDRQLYALIAIIVKEFISSWYSKITSDQTLIDEILQVIAHCTRALEQRLRETDVAQLVLDEIPALIEGHITSYRLAKEQSDLSGFSPSSRDIYHALNPHPGLSPVPDPTDIQTISQQRENEATYRRLLVNGVMAVLLPTEDLENASLRTLLNDILADLILGNEVSERVCEGWFLWGSITKVLDVLSRDEAEGRDDATVTELSRSNRLQEFGLLSPQDEEGGHSSPTTQSGASGWIWRILQYAYLAYVTLCFIVAGLFRVASTPPVIFTPSSAPSASPVDKLPTQYGHIGKRPVLDYRLYGMLSQLLDVPRRMPWLAGLLALFQYLILAGPGKLGDVGSVLDRFLHEIIQDHVLPPTLLPNLLRASREALFPHNARPRPAASANHTETLTSGSAAHRPEGAQSSTTTDTKTITAVGGSTSTPALTVTTTTTAASALSPLSPDEPQQQHPSPAEIASIRRTCAVRILSLIPRPIARRLLGIIPAHTGAKKESPPEAADSSCDSQKRDPSPSSSAFSNGEAEPEASKENSLLLAAIENDILDLFADEYCNKHLIYSIIETVIAKLLPELSDRSIGELMDDRGVFSPTG